MNWTQVYNPLNNIYLSALIALIPIVYFFWALAIKKTKGYIAGLITVVLAVLVSIIVYGMPASMAISSTIYGSVVGLWPIGWIVINAVFLYKITVKTGQFDIIRKSITSLTEDRRLQALLIAFSFSAFIEGAAGFGTPVAISAALLVGLGFKPLYAAGICMIANTAPVAFGAIGIPIITAAKTSGIEVLEISKIAGIQLGLLAIIVPFWVVITMSGLKGVKETWPAILVSGCSFGVSMWLTATYLGPELPAIVAPLLSLLCLAFFLKVWKPANTFRFEDEVAPVNMEKTPHYSTGTIIKAWSPFIILTGLITLWGIPSIKAQLATTNISIEWPALHNLILKAAPIVTEPVPYGAVYNFDWLAAAGTSILIAAFISMFVVKMSFTSWVETYVENLKELKYPLITISCVLGFAYIANYSGMSSTLGLAAAKTGGLFPLVSPILGWIGVFLTGSDTSSCALFGNLQKISATQIGVNPVLTVASNATGGVAGKMISPQSLAVAAASTGLVGKESDILRFTLKHSIAMVLLISIMTYLMSFIL
jgi:lactate permease